MLDQLITFFISNTVDKRPFKIYCCQGTITFQPSSSSSIPQFPFKNFTTAFLCKTHTSLRRKLWFLPALIFSENSVFKYCRTKHLFSFMFSKVLSVSVRVSAKLFLRKTTDCFACSSSLTFQDKSTFYTQGETHILLPRFLSFSREFCILSIHVTTAN